VRRHRARRDDAAQQRLPADTHVPLRGDPRSLGHARRSQAGSLRNAAGPDPVSRPAGCGPRRAAARATRAAEPRTARGTTERSAIGASGDAAAPGAASACDAVARLRADSTDSARRAPDLAGGVDAAAGRDAEP